MKSFVPKKGSLEKKWYVIDATDVVLGRLASQVAAILRGKNKPEFTPFLDTGDYVIVINAEKIKLTGDKLLQKTYDYHTGYPGGLKSITYKDMLIKKPEKVIELAVKGMLPKNTLGRQMYRKLRVYKGENHGHEAQQPEVLDLNK